MGEDGTTEGGLLFELYNMMSFQNKVKSCILLFSVVVADNNSWLRDHVGIFVAWQHDSIDDWKYPITSSRWINADDAIYS